MENRQDQNSDVSKSQSAQQPATDHKDRSEENRQSTQDSPDQPQSSASDSGTPKTSQSGFGETQSDTLTGQRSDIEGSSATGQAGESSGFVGAEGNQDTSSELIEDKDDSEFAKDGQGSTE